ncbi:hypothetical protein [Amycolatopsis sp. cmx-11-51]|uniref:hypothetical protein n=1 Tax=unclassified Amycolatopsis TaxID=2618356 RepID=UPI0039E4E1AC
MSQGPDGQAPPAHGTDSPSTSQRAKDEAKEVAGTVAERGDSVVKTAVAEAKHVAEHSQHEARDLLREGRGQLEEQARNGQRQAAQSLHGLAGQLDRMAERAESPGVATDLARQASGHVDAVAHWLDEREPGQLVDEVRRFARRRPGTFLVGAAIAGAIVGRLTRAAVAGEPKESGSRTETAQHPGQASASPAPGAPSLPSEPSPVTPAQPAIAEGALPNAAAGPAGFSAPQPPAPVPPIGARTSASGEMP